MGVRKRSSAERDPIVRGPTWVAYLPGRPYGRHAPYLRFVVLSYAWPPIPMATPTGVFLPAFSVTRHIVIFDVTRVEGADHRWVAFDLQTKNDVARDDLLQRFIDRDVLPACYERFFQQAGDAELEDFAALVPDPWCADWFRRATAPMELCSAAGRSRFAKLRALATGGRAQKTPRARQGSTIALYNRAYLQWTRRSLKGSGRDHKYVKQELDKAEGRRITWSKADHELHGAVYRRVFDDAFVTTLRAALIQTPPPKWTVEQLEQGLVMDILLLLEQAYGVELKTPIQSGTQGPV